MNVRLWMSWEMLMMAIFSQTVISSPIGNVIIHHEVFTSIIFSHDGCSSLKCALQSVWQIFESLPVWSWSSVLLCRYRVLHRCIEWCGNLIDIIHEPHMSMNRNILRLRVLIRRASAFEMIPLIMHWCARSVYFFSSSN